MRRNPGRPYGLRAMFLGGKERGASLLREAAVLVLAGVIPVAVSSQQKAALATSLVFDGVTVVDVEQGKLVPDQRVVIAGNRIQTVGSLSAVAIPKGAQVVSAKDKYLIPGLWDMHVHPGEPADVPRGATEDLTYLLFIANGVTGFRDARSMVPMDTMVRWRHEILAGTRVGPPRQLLSGVAIGGGGTPCTGVVNGFTGHVCDVSDTADIEKLVRSLKAAGADMLKTYDLRQGAYFMVAAAARREGLLFGGHAANVSPFDAADSGASILDHVGREHVGILDSLCFDPDQATVDGCRAVAERFKKTNTWSVPTLSNRSLGYFADASPQVVPHLLQKAVAEFWANFTYDPTWLHNHETLSTPATPDTLHFGYLKIPMQVGLPILSGGDTWEEESGFKTHADLAILVDRGLTPLAALQAATLNPAKMLKATDSLGTVAPGKLADLVVLDANPLADITNTTMIHAVVANGRYFDRAALDGLLAQIRTKVHQHP
jgi:hypothetical protein